MLESSNIRIGGSRYILLVGENKAKEAEFKNDGHKHYVGQHNFYGKDSKDEYQQALKKYNEIIEECRISGVEPDVKLYEEITLYKNIEIQ